MFCGHIFYDCKICCILSVTSKNDFFLWFSSDCDSVQVAYKSVNCCFELNLSFSNRVKLLLSHNVKVNLQVNVIKT